MTRQARVLTTKGVKPIGSFRQRFQNKYLYGMIGPSSGETFFMSADQTNTVFFQCFLDQFSQQNPRTYKIIFLDRASYHKSKELKVPENICLWHIPLYSAELNPVERFWQEVKRGLAWVNFDNIQKLEQWIDEKLMSFSRNAIISITQYPHIKDAIQKTEKYAL